MTSTTQSAELRVGAAVRRRRQDLGLTLDEVAERCGVSRAMISEVERDSKSPTIRVLAQIAHGLDCAITDFLGGPGEREVQHLTPAQYERLTDPESQVVRESLAPALVRHGIELVRYTLPPNAALCDCPPRAPEEMVAVHVIKGRMRIRVGEASYEVASGESLSYVPDVPTDLVNAARGETVALFVLDASRRGA